MRESDTVAAHYARGDLLEAVRSGIDALGKTPETVTTDDLAPVDEFHIGGREGSENLLGQLALDKADRVLDIGCGLGGAARFVADRYGCRVSGIDLTAEYVEVGETLCRWTGLGGRIELHEGDALATPFDKASFDAAYMMHVGMNVADKVALCAEVHRVLRVNAVFGVYDVMRTGDGDILFPVPWAAEPGNSAVATPDDYRAALEDVGFEIVGERRRGDFALDFFERMRAKLAAADGPPPLGLHLLMGGNASEKIANMIENIATGRLEPTEIIARKVRC